MILFLGNGFIAAGLSAFMDKLKIEHRILSQGIDNNPPFRIRAEIASLTERSPAFDGVSTIVYLAHSSVPYSSMNDIFEDAKQSVLSAISLFEIVAKKNIRIIYISSGGSVYGNHRDPVSEQTLPSPISAYGVSKYTIENYLKLFHHNFQLPYDILRLSNVYGIGQNNKKPQGVISALAQAFVKKEKFTMWGDGTAKKDYLYIDDAVEAIAKVIEKQPSNDTFNLSYGASTSINEILSRFQSIFGYQIPVESALAFLFDVQNVFLDNEKLSQAYDWTPKTDIDTGIAKTVQWFSEQQ